MLHDLPVERLPSELWARQRAAADCVLNAFAMGYERQQVIMPCGTGKTHLAVHIAHELTPASRSLTVLPTLQLLNQTARVWYTSGRPGHYLGVCSDAQTSEPVLDGVLTMTSDPAHLAAAVRTADGPVSVFATYASLPKIAEAHRRHLLPRWDIAVVDEAHRTAGARRKPWAVIHDNDAVAARHRLYLTATPRIWDVNRGIITEPIASMDDACLYGPVAYRYSLAEAIHEGRLADYRIAAPEIHHPQLHALLTGRNGASRTPQADAMRVAAAQLALLKAREEHGIRRTVVFSSSIAASEAFADTLPETAAALPAGHGDDLWVASLHSGHGRRERRQRLDHFGQPPHDQRGNTPTELSVLCTVRLCIEGVDFPLADSVLFAEPKHSTIDIVQAIGRALRITPGMNKIATLVIPVLFGPGQRAEDAMFGTPYHLLHQVMIALKAYDEHYFHRLPTGGTLLGPPVLAAAVRPARASEIAPHLILRVMEPQPDVWEAGMACAQAFFDAHGHLNVPSNHITADGFHLGCWLGYQRALKAAGTLSAARVAALATCTMPWAHAKDSTETFLTTARDYARSHGHLLPEAAETHQGQPLGSWLEEQRRLAAASTLPTPYRRALKDIDPWWNPAWPQAWQRMCARARTAGTPLSLCPGPLPTDADDLTRWLDEQFDAFPALAKGQQTQLAALPLQHDPLALALRTPAGHKDTTHAHGLRAARRFYRRHQHLQVPAHYTDHEGGTSFPLGRWIADQRTRASEDRLTREETDSLQALAVEWTPRLPPHDTQAASPGPRTQTISTSGAQAPAAQPPHVHTRSDPVFRIACTTPPAGLPDITFHGASRMQLTKPAGADKIMTAAVAVHEAVSLVCLLLGAHTAYLHAAFRTWRTVSKGLLAGLDTCPTRHGKAGAQLNGVAGELAAWMAQQPPGALVIARHLDPAHSQHLPLWEHLVAEEAHRTAEGIITQDRLHAAIHYDDGGLARPRPRPRLSLTATQPIPRELPAQTLIGTHHLTVQRHELVETGLFSPYQLLGIRVPETPAFPRWRTQAFGSAHIIEQHRLRRVVAVLADMKQAEALACQLAVRMVDAEIFVPGQGLHALLAAPAGHPGRRVSDPVARALDASSFSERCAGALVPLGRDLFASLLS
ncbi:Helicase associated domain protein [Streptomyces sp. NPDC091268]|uniref:Helicase associated domain protein n=1 Tax=Streptomyces sp. NPDC091268 TaxID=3365979 RepID=UPI0038160207